MDALTRDFTATTFVVRDRRTLLLWHRKVQAWFPPGGHIHPGELPEEAAIREVREESGLEVRLFGEQQHWGNVKVLHRPHCILLENISPGHQHIDLIYFAYAPTTRPRIHRREAGSYRWVNHAELNLPEIAEDIRRLGQQAIALLGTP